MKLKQIIHKILNPARFESPATIKEEVVAGASIPSGSADISLERPEFEYIPDGWEYLHEHPEVKGWDVEDILQVYLKQWEPFVEMARSAGPLSGIHESVLAKVSIEGHNSIMIFAYALALAAHQRTHLSMLDWGGGIGHYYLIAKALMPMIDLEYHCKDTPILSNHGQKLFQEAFFYSDASCLDRQYDFVLASGSLQYWQDWSDTLAQLARATSGYLLVTRLPIVKTVPSYVFIQRPYLHMYNTEYLAWCLNREEFLNCAQESGLYLVREFLVGDNHPIRNAPEKCEYLGFLFRK
jgi:putative methyltransferase (TIGR04325 family)